MIRTLPTMLAMLALAGPFVAPASAAADEPAPPAATTPPQDEGRAAPPSEAQLIPGSRALSLDLGFARAVLGGWAYPRIGSNGAADARFHAHGAGASFRLQYDFPAMDLDWRVGLRGAVPGYFGALATIGVTKSLGPWRNPQVLARGAAGVELMVARGDPKASYAVPAVLGETELAVRVDVVENLLSVGPVLALGVRYGLPLGIGYDAAALVRIAAHW